MTFVAALRAESAKLAHRPSVWALLLGPYLGWLALHNFAMYLTVRTRGAAVLGTDAEGNPMLDLLPPTVVESATRSLPLMGAALAVVVAVLVMGGEYGFDTLKLSLTQGPRRAEVLAAKVMLVTASLAALLVLAFLVAAGASAMIAALEGEPLDFPPAADFLAGFASGLLSLTTWAALGLLLATLTRGTGLSIGLALVYLIAIEGVAETMALEYDIVARAYQWMVSPNVETIVSSISEPLLATGVEIAPTRAALLLAGYCAAALAISAGFMQRRDA